MKNLVGAMVLGSVLYVMMGGSLPSFDHYLGDDDIAYDNTTVGGEDVFVGLHVTQDADGMPHISGVSHWGRLLRHVFWSKFLQRDPAVQRSYVAQVEDATVPSLPCDVSFVDVLDDEKGKAVDLLGDLCLVSGVGSKFYPINHARRGDILKMTVGAIMYVYGVDLPENQHSSYDDVPISLQSYLAQAELWDIDEFITRDGKVFGVDDVMTRDEVVVFLEKAVASLPGHMSRGDTMKLPLATDHIKRDDYALMVVDSLDLYHRSESFVASR